jgi:hypothetical protein
MEEEVVVTEQLLLEGRSGSGGWQSRVLGQRISREVAERFVALATRTQGNTLFDGDDTP